MKRTDNPVKQPTPFAASGQRTGSLPPTTPTGSNAASYGAGFPPVTMITKPAGGIPPNGPDMNQILFELSSLGRWASAGALNAFDSAFSASIGGYPKGAVIISNDGATIFVNTVDDNTNDPNSLITGWSTLLAYLGLGPIANAADITAGTAKKLIDAYGLNSYFPARGFGASGYIRIPNQPGGLIVQWGSIPPIPAGGSIIVNYGQAFPGGFLAIAPIAGSSPAAANSVLSSGGGDAKSSFQIFNSLPGVTSATGAGVYIALGF